MFCVYTMCLHFFSATSSVPTTRSTHVNSRRLRSTDCRLFVAQHHTFAVVQVAQPQSQLRANVAPLTKTEVSEDVRRTSENTSFKNHNRNISLNMISTYLFSSYLFQFPFLHLAFQAPSHAGALPQTPRSVTWDASKSSTSSTVSSLDSSPKSQSVSLQMIFFAMLTMLTMLAPLWSFSPDFISFVSFNAIQCLAAA